MADDGTTTRRRPRRSYPSNGTGGRPKTARATPTTVEPPITFPTPPSRAEDDSSIGAGRRHLRRSAVGRVEAGDLSVAIGAVGAARADQVTVDKGAVGAAMADRVEVSRGYARSILARNVQLDRAAARVVVAADVSAQRTAVMFLVARRVSGDIRVLFDWRGALAFGAIAGLIAGLVARSRRPR